MDDKIIRFPGGAAAADAKPKAKAAKRRSGEPPAGVVDPATLDDDQKKALQIVFSGLPFVLVGIKAAASGADFYTAVHGEPADLRNAAPHLPGVIERAFARKGL